MRYKTVRFISIIALCLFLQQLFDVAHVECVRGDYETIMSTSINRFYYIRPLASGERGEQQEGVNLYTVNSRARNNSYYSAYLLALACEEMIDNFPEGLTGQIADHISDRLKRQIKEFYDELAENEEDESRFNEIVACVAAALKGVNATTVPQVLEMAGKPWELGETDYIISLMHVYERLVDLFGPATSHLELCALAKEVAGNVFKDCHYDLFYQAAELKKSNSLTLQSFEEMVSFYNLFDDPNYQELVSYILPIFSARPLSEIKYIRLALNKVFYRPAAIKGQKDYNLYSKRVVIECLEYANTYRGRIEEFPLGLIKHLMERVGISVLADLDELAAMVSTYAETPDFYSSDFLCHATPISNADRLLIDGQLKSEKTLLEEGQIISSGDVDDIYDSIEEKKKLPRYADNKDKKVVADENVWFIVGRFDMSYTDYQDCMGIAIPIDPLPDNIKNMINRQDIGNEQSVDCSLPLERAIFFIDSNSQKMLIEKLRLGLGDKAEEKIARFLRQVFFINRKTDMNKALAILTTRAGKLVLMPIVYPERITERTSQGGVGHLGRETATTKELLHQI
jgi:hypothetical protein